MIEDRHRRQTCVVGFRASVTWPGAGWTIFATCSEDCCSPRQGERDALLLLNWFAQTVKFLQERERFVLPRHILRDDADLANISWRIPGRQRAHTARMVLESAWVEAMRLEPTNGSLREPYGPSRLFCRSRPERKPRQTGTCDASDRRAQGLLPPTELQIMHASKMYWI